MTARDDVLGAFRPALADVPGDEPPTAEPGGYDVSLPGDRESAVRLFCERVDAYRATVRRVARDDLARVVATTLADRGIHSLAVPPGVPAEWLPESVDVTRDDGELGSARLDQIDGVVTGAALGIALTGTIVLDAGPDQGRRLLSLVPDYHLCVVGADAVVGTVPEAMARLGAERPLTLISGPSATSDIELDRIEGVHGPRTLDVLLIDA
ncbi:MAG: LutC/YkgG family protein [Mycobacteriales bacterium]